MRFSAQITRDWTQIGCDRPAIIGSGPHSVRTDVSRVPIGEMCQKQSLVPAIRNDGLWPKPEWPLSGAEARSTDIRDGCRPLSSLRTVRIYLPQFGHCARDHRRRPRHIASPSRLWFAMTLCGVDPYVSL